MKVDIKKAAGGWCGCAEARVDDFDANLKNTSDFPADKVATKQEKMNEPAPKAAEKYKSVGDCKFRDVSTTEANPTGGVYNYKNGGHTYQGQYKGGLRSGLGLEISKDGRIYSGNFANDAAEGKMHAFYDNGDYYQG